MTITPNLGGRPKLSDDERRCEQTKIRLTIAEKIYLQEQADHADLSLAEFVRRRALSLSVAPSQTKIDAKLIYEFNAIGVNLNQLTRNQHTGRQGVNDLDWSLVQDQLQEVLKKIVEGF